MRSSQMDDVKRVVSGLRNQIQNSNQVVPKSPWDKRKNAEIKKAELKLLDIIMEAVLKIEQRD